MSESKLFLAKKVGWNQFEQVAPRWAEISEHSANSFFLSPEWVQTWLYVFGPSLDPDLLIFADQTGASIAACILVKKITWHKMFPLRSVYFNCAGEDELDGTCIEYNHLLCRTGTERVSFDALKREILNYGWDRFEILGAMEQDCLSDLASELGTVEIDARPSYFVDLCQLRKTDKQFEEVLSPNTRQQIRRSAKLYEQRFGALSLTVADTQKQALILFEELSELHQAAWTNKGQPGVFGSSIFKTFHHSLIRGCFVKGYISLIRVSAGARTIGVLYSFAYKGRVYFYQSGFLYDDDNRLKPGLVTHFHAITYYLNRSALSEYDFLAGESQYKRSLGTKRRNISWMTVERRTLKMRLLRRMIAFWRKT